MKKEFETFIVWYVPLAIISKFLSTFVSAYFANYAVGGSYSIQDFKSIMLLVGIFIGSIENIVGTIWICKQKPTTRLSPWIWGAFTLFTGLWGILFYILLSIYEEFKAKTENNKFEQNDEVNEI